MCKLFHRWAQSRARAIRQQQLIYDLDLENQQLKRDIETQKMFRNDSISIEINRFLFNRFVIGNNENFIFNCLRTHDKNFSYICYYIYKT